MRTNSETYGNDVNENVTIIHRYHYPNQTIQCFITLKKMYE